MSRTFLLFLPNTSSDGEKPVERQGTALIADSAKGKNWTSQSCWMLLWLTMASMSHGIFLRCRSPVVCRVLWLYVLFLAFDMFGPSPQM